MGENKISEILGRAIGDPAFRQGLLNDPAHHLEGYNLSLEEIASLQAALGGDDEGSEAEEPGSRKSPWVVNTLGFGGSGT